MGRALGPGRTVPKAVMALMTLAPLAAMALQGLAPAVACPAALARAEGVWGGVLTALVAAMALEAGAGVVVRQEAMDLVDLAGPVDMAVGLGDMAAEQEAMQEALRTGMAWGLQMHMVQAASTGNRALDMAQTPVMPARCGDVPVLTCIEDGVHNPLPCLWFARKSIFMVCAASMKLYAPSKPYTLHLF